MKLDKDYRKSGIYKIINIVNNKIYIGSAKNLGKRISGHYRDLVRNKHNNAHLQRSWNKYSANSFRVEVVEYCPVDELISREQYYLDLGTNYNICPVAYSTLGRKQTKEEIEKRVSKLRGRRFPKEFGEAVSLRMKGRVVSEQTKRNISLAHTGTTKSWNFKPILQYNKDGEFIAEWPNLTQVVKSFQVSYSGLSNCLKGRAKSAGGYVWKYKDKKHV